MQTFRVMQSEPEILRLVKNKFISNRFMTFNIVKDR